MNNETVSIIIPVHNEAHRLEDTLRAVRDAADLPYRTIVVDDLSTDGCTDSLASGLFHEVTLIRPTTRLGVAGARNRGARVAGTPIVVFMDGHCYPEAGFLSRMTLALRRLGRGIVVPCITVHGSPDASGFGMTLTGPDLGATWLSALGSDPYPVPLGCGCVQMFFKS